MPVSITLKMIGGQLGVNGDKVTVGVVSWEYVCSSPDGDTRGIKYLNGVTKIEDAAKVIVDELYPDRKTKTKSRRKPQAA